MRHPELPPFCRASFATMLLTLVLGSLVPPTCWSQDPQPRAEDSHVSLGFVLLAKPKLPAGKDVAKAFSAFAVEGQRLEPEPSAKGASDVLGFNLDPCGLAFVAL